MKHKFTAPKSKKFFNKSRNDQQYSAKHEGLYHPDINKYAEM